MVLPLYFSAISLHKSKWKEVGEYEGASPPTRKSAVTLMPAN